MKANGLKMVSIRLVDDPPIYSEDKIQNPNDAVQLLLKEFDSVDRELFFVLNLKTNGQVINVNIASMGTLNSCILSPREIFKASILSNAASVILMHNHPSGDCTPSKQDVLMTKRLVACGELIGITVLDHVILGNKNIKKADIFYKQTIAPVSIVKKVDTAMDALKVSLAEYGKVHIPYMLSVYPVERERLLQELKGQVFLNPVKAASFSFFDILIET